jgi:hypothetical protein
VTSPRRASGAHPATEHDRAARPRPLAAPWACRHGIGRAGAGGKAVLAVCLLAFAGTLWAAPLDAGSQPPGAAPVSHLEGIEDAALAPLHVEQQSTLQARDAEALTEDMLRSDFDSRGPTWMHNGGLVNPADHPTRLEHNPALQEYMRRIEAAGQPARPTAAPATPTSVATARETWTDLSANPEPRGALSWLRSQHAGAVAGTVVVLLMLSWFAVALRRRRPHRSRRHRHHRSDSGALSSRTHRRRRRHHRRQREPATDDRRAA